MTPVPAERFTATYRIRAEAAAIEARARAIAVEQSVEMPLEAIDDPAILRDIVGRVDDIFDVGAGVFAVRIALATATVGQDGGQLLNMLFGNTSLHEDVVLWDAELPPGLFAGPGHGISGLRARVGASARALTCAAIKPQGVPPARLAELTARFAGGGVDFIKDDHGLADQSYSRFADRVRACAAATSGTATRYAPSLSGNLDQMRAQIALARDAGIGAVLIAPMIAGAANMQALVRDNPDMAFFAHPTLAGAARIAPELLIGKIFPALGADAVVFPTYGGRFGYSEATCARLANNARAAGAFPVPAGGMTLARVSEKLDFYGPDTMLLIGGSLLLARDGLTEAAAAFTAAVARHVYRPTD